MNDYIAKAVDERILYNKIVGLVKKPVLVKYNANEGNHNGQSKRIKCTDLNYLIRRTKSDPELMMEMISLFLEQTPPLIAAMKRSLREKDWELLHATVHKMILSFSITGISQDFENIAKQVRDYAISQKQNDGILYLVLHLEDICEQPCVELQNEFTIIKNAAQWRLEEI